MLGQEITQPVQCKGGCEKFCPMWRGSSNLEYVFVRIWCVKFHSSTSLISILLHIIHHNTYVTTGLLLVEQAAWTKANEDVLAANRLV